MDVHQSKCSGLSLFSRGRCQVLLKSATKKNRFFSEGGGTSVHRLALSPGARMFFLAKSAMFKLQKRGSKKWEPK